MFRTNAGDEAMCYMLLLSTSSDVDLARHNSAFVHFSRELPGIPEESYLRYDHKWFIESMTGCSCAFRHLCAASVELGFDQPQDWFPEEPSDIEATLQVIAAIRELVGSGERVDCVDAWSHDQAVADPLAADIDVDLSEVGNERFRFFENHRFNFAHAA